MDELDSALRITEAALGIQLRFDPIIEPYTQTQENWQLFVSSLRSALAIRKYAPTRDIELALQIIFRGQPWLPEVLDVIKQVQDKVIDESRTLS